jgi:hypothetical protein
MTGNEYRQAREFGNFHLVKADEPACEQADHQHQDSGCVFLFHWIEFSFG